MGGARSAAWVAATVGFGLAVVVTNHEPAVVVAAIVFALGLALLVAVGRRWRGFRNSGVVLTLALVNVGLALGSAALVGSVRAQSPQAEAWLRGAPVVGVHPMQHVGLVLDGFGPHDLVVPDHVEPQGSRGLTPEQLAAALQAQIRRVGRVAYPLDEAAPWVGGRPLAGRIAWVGARVEVDPARADGGLESFRLRIVSGGRGPGASVRAVCASSPARYGVVPGSDAPIEAGGECPRRYVFPGDAGLGLRPRWGAEMRDGDWPRPWAGRPVLVPPALLGVAWGIAVAGAWRTRSGPRGGLRSVVGLTSGVICSTYLVVLAALAAGADGSAHRRWSDVHVQLVDTMGIFVGIDSAHALSVLQAVLAAVPVLGLLGLSAALLAQTSGSRAVRTSTSTGTDSGSERAPAHVP